MSWIAANTFDETISVPQKYHHAYLFTFRYLEVTSPESPLQQTLKLGEDAISKVYIGYLATRLNSFDLASLNSSSENNSSASVHENQNYNQHEDTYVLEKWKFKLSSQNSTVGQKQEAAYSNDGEKRSRVVSESAKDKERAVTEIVDIVRSSRASLLTILERLPVRDEVNKLYSFVTEYNWVKINVNSDTNVGHTLVAHLVEPLTCKLRGGCRFDTGLRWMTGHMY